MEKTTENRILSKAADMPASTLKELAANIAVAAKELGVELTVAEIADLAEEANYDLP